MKALAAPSQLTAPLGNKREEMSEHKSIAVKYFLSSSAAAVAETGKYSFSDQRSC